MNPPPFDVQAELATAMAVVAALRPGDPTWRWRRVRTTHYRRHFKPDRPVSLRLDYECADGQRYSEWVCLEHAGYPREKAEQWWRKRVPHLPVPDTVDDALRIATRIRPPSEIAIVQVGQYPEIRGTRFDT